MIKTIVLAAPPETVWAFLTEADKLGTWFHPAAADLVEGGDFALVSSGESSGDDEDRRICWGKVLEMQKPHRLVYTFTIKPLGGHTTQVSWDLEAFSDGTRLTMTHDGIEEAAGDAAFGLMQALDKGWDEHFGKLRSAVA